MLLNALQPNPTTGFLESNNPNTLEAFDSAKKVAFLEMARKYVELRQLPDVGKINKELGIAYSTFNYHVNNDPAFRRAWDELKMQNYTGLANELSIKANSKNGIIANIAVLKYLERGRFSDDPPINSNDYGQLKDVIVRDNQVIDAEIVKNDQNISTNQPNTNAI